MADGAEIITLDSDDEADSSNNISEQPRSSGEGMSFDPANYADLMSKASQSRFMAPLVRAMANERQVKPKSTMSGNKKFPKRPGVFPPFALFTQEHREQLMKENKDLSFADVGRTLGEMWHKLTDTQKEDYRTRAKDLTEKKLKAWQEQVRQLPPQQQQQIHSQQGHSSHQGGMGIVKRRRTHGYAIFSSEMRKKMGDAIPLSETTRVIAEKWRNADGPTRHDFEARAAKVNEQEAKRYQSMLIQNQRRQQAMQLQQQQLQRQRMQLAGRQGSSNAMAQRLMGDVSQSGSSGLRISSVSSLKKSSSRQVTPNVSLPSSISISRVQPDDIRQRLPAGTSMITSSTSSSNSSQQSSRGSIRPMPKLKRGARSGVGVSPQNSQHTAWQQQMMANPLRQNQLRALQQQQGVENANGLMGSIIPGMKRAAAPVGGIRKRMRGGVIAGVPGLGKPARLCRVCCQTNVANFRLSERPDLIRAVEFIIDLKIDIAEDKKLGMPSVICRKCCTVVITFDQFKRSVEEGQKKLIDIMERRKIREAKRLEQQQEQQDQSEEAELIEVSPTVMFTSSPSGEESVSPGVTTSDALEEGSVEEDNDDADTDIIIPNLECDVEINEDPESVPQPMSIKEEKINDIKSNSIESAETSLLVKGEKRDSSPISSPINEKETDKLDCDLAEFETDVIGQQLDVKNSDNSSFKQVSGYNPSIAAKDIDYGTTSQSSKKKQEQTTKSPNKNGSIGEKEVGLLSDGNESTETEGSKGGITTQANCMENNVGDFDNFEIRRNGHNNQEEIGGEPQEKASLEYEDGVETQELEEEGDNQDHDEPTDPDMDLSLLHDEDGIDDSDVDKSNDDAEAIKLLNEDDDAFESFLHDDETSNDNLIPSSSKSNTRGSNEEKEIQHASNDTGNKYPDNSREEEVDELVLDNEVVYENEEELIDDEMEGDEDY